MTSTGFEDEEDTSSGAGGILNMLRKRGLVQDSDADKANAAVRAQQPQAPVRLLYHGRVDRRKGALDMLDALAILRDEGVPFAATISGIGPDLDACRERDAELNLGTRFAGYADYAAAPALYREADVFVSPTYAEGFSNTVLEAMASGLPTVSCNAVGVVDCLRHEENGLLSDPGDIPAIPAAAQLL